MGRTASGIVVDEAGVHRCWWADQTEDYRAYHDDELEFDHEVDVTVWYQGPFGLSGNTLASLVTATKNFDFAVLVLTPDDLVQNEKRETKGNAPRDNVLFELGLFMGSLGPKRTFIVYDRTENLKLCRTLLQSETPDTPAEPDSLVEEACDLCPHCQRGRMHIVQRIPLPRIPEILRTPWPWDTS